VVPVDPAGSVREPRHVVTSRETPVLDPSEARALLDSIDVSTHAGLRDRALIGLMVNSFARIGAALGMTVEDVFTQNRRLWLQLREKGGKRQISDRVSRRRRVAQRPKRAAVPPERPRHRQAHAYGAAAGERLCDDRRRAAAAGIATKLGKHSFRATGITAYLKNGGALEKAAAMANHGSTQLYDRRRDEVSLDEVEQIVI
jgi:integrase